MAMYHEIILFLAIIFLFLHENALCNKDIPSFFLRRNAHLKRSWRDETRERRAVTPNKPVPTAKEKETNQLVLAALYGGLGQGIQSSENFDYAKGLDPKIVSAGGYGLPTGIYSYAFDPSTGMPFMCDPTKTPPGGAKSQAAGVAAVNPPAATAGKPKADDTSGIVPSGSVPSDKISENVSSGNTPSGNTPSGDTSTEIGGSVPSPDVHPSSTNPNEVAVASAPVTNTVGTNAAPEHRLAPVTNTSPSHHKAQNDAPPVLNKTPGSSLENDETNDDEENNDDLMTSSSPSNDEDDTSMSSEDNSTSSPITNKITSPPSVTNPAKQLTGNNEQNRVSNHVKQSGITSSEKEVHVKLGQPLYLPNPKINPQSNLQNKITNTRLTPLIDNYHKELMVPKGRKVKRSNSMKKYIESKKAAKKNGITIKLPTIPPCPDMKDYHWPWNCLGKGNTVKRECIQNYGGTFSYNGATYPYEDYGHIYDDNDGGENGNYYNNDKY